MTRSDDAIFCLEWSDKTGAERWKSIDDLVATYTTNYFESSKVLTFDGGQQKGIHGIGAVNRFLVAAIVELLNNFE